MLCEFARKFESIIENLAYECRMFFRQHPRLVRPQLTEARLVGVPGTLATVILLLAMSLPLICGRAEEPAIRPPAKSAPLPAEPQLAARAVQLLQRRCVVCHGPEAERQGELDLRTLAAALRGGESGEAALVPGAPDKSAIYRAVRRQGDLQMPPKDNDKLNDDEIDLLRRWIAAGAEWPNDLAVATLDPLGKEMLRVKTSAGLSRDWEERPYARADVWAWRPLLKSEPPQAAPGASTHPIDRFLEAELQKKQIVAAGPATSSELLRRVAWDLTGLPPAAEDLARYGTDLTPANYAAYVDQLLGSRAYAERAAQHWLDVVRYADTGGFSNDYERPHAWRYRDYVIKSFAEDKPYNRFIIEQIAGDEFSPDDPESLIAVSFLRMGPWEHTAMSSAAVTRQMFLDDVTNSVGVTFLGQGMSCCRCHDHKFDPLPTRDYYALQAVFAGTQFADRRAPFAKDAAPQPDPRELDFLKRQREKDSLTPLQGNIGDALKRVIKKRNEYLDRAEKRYLPLAMSVENRGQEQTQILTGGRLESPAGVVSAGALSAMTDLGQTPPPKFPKENSGLRLALAQWIASDTNTLTARVIVNRVWQQHFGVGLVATPNNFGKMGKRPTHPELLDWLARRFMEDGWSIKKLHRLILTSAAYQRSTKHPQAAKLREQDPSNTLLAYFSPRRLTAEELRDGMLAVSGELSLSTGGPGVFPEYNPEVALQPRHIMGGIAPAWSPSRTRAERHRRAIYAFHARTLPDPLLEVFNRPASDASCERREESNIPTQVFELLNGQFTRDRALAIAASVAAKHEDDPARIRSAYQRVLGRVPSATEQQQCAEHLAAMQKLHEAHPPKPRALPEKVEREMIAEQSGELFRWEERLDWQDFEPDLQPWQVEASVRALAEVCLVLLNSNEFSYVY